MQFSTCISSSVILDQLLWQLWLMGLSAPNALIYCANRCKNPISEEALLSFIKSQYIDFDCLQDFLYDPRTLYTQITYDIPAEIFDYLITTYYSFDITVVRILLSKKFASKTRKELDEVHQITGYPLNGCKRIFENIKRVIKEVEDCESSVITAIENTFLLPVQLANEYANIVFLSYHKLTTDGGNLDKLDLSSLLEISKVLMKCFSLTSEPCLILDDDGILENLRELKIILYSNKALIESLKTNIQQKLISYNENKIFEKASIQHFRLFIRNLLSIGVGINHSKEFKDILVNINERILPLLLSMGIPKSKFKLFFTCLKESFNNLSIFKTNTNLINAFNTLIEAIEFTIIKITNSSDTITSNTI